jgi:PAS domain S-box-containing protein
VTGSDWRGEVAGDLDDAGTDTGPGVARPPDEASAVEALFAGPGAARAALRAVNWSGTPLGPVRSWPAALRTTVRTVLASRFPMIVFWGPEYVQIYNDGFAPSLLDKAAAGRPGRESWSEVWDWVGDQLDLVALSGQADYFQDQLVEVIRRGFVEESYFTYSHSPIYSEDDRYAGVLTTTTETTDRVLAERRLDTLSRLATAGAGVQTLSEAFEMAAGALGHNPLDIPFALLYQVDESGTATLAGHTGLPRGDPAAPDRVELRGTGDVWSLAAALDGDEPVPLHDLTTRFPALRAGPWPERPEAAVLLALRPVTEGQPAGVLVAGLSPRLEPDARYREFLDLVAARVVASLGDAHTRESGRRRIELMTELDRAKTEFFANVSHEFRTPLTLILGPLEQLRSKVDEPELRAELDTVRRNGQRLGRLVDALLDFSRVEAGRAEARFEPTDMCAATEELASTFRSAMHRARLGFEVVCDTLDEPVYLDRSLWEQIVLNLLSNALKYTLTGTVGIRLSSADGAAVLRVEDTGVGIPEAEMGRLFERFHRVTQAHARSSEGSGIGLALARKLAELHGGTLTAVSTVDAGSVFTVTIPFGRGHLPADQVFEMAVAPTSRPAATGYLAEALRWLPTDRHDTDQRRADQPDGDQPAADRPPPALEAGRVLVVDDNADMRDYLNRLLTGNHFVQLVGDGRSALDAARADPPDLVLSDVMLPDLDGIALVRALRADPGTAAVPVVLLSARADQQAAMDGLAAGADDYLVKPFIATELLARLNGHLRLGRARRDAELRFRSMADALPTMMWVEEPDLRRVFVNRAWSEFVGGRDDGARADQGTGWRRHVHPDDLPGYLEARAAAEARGGPFELEYRLRRADGRYRWVLDRGAPLAGLTRVGGYVGGCMDIDTRHREEHRQRVLAALAEALTRDISLEARRTALAQTLVDEGLVDVVRLIDADESRPVAYAARLPEHRELVAALRGPWTHGTAALASGEPSLTMIDDDYLEASSPDPEQRDIRRRLGLNSVALIPMTARGRIAGLLGCGRSGSSPKLDEADFELLVEISERAAIALDNALLLELDQHTSQRLELLQRATAALSAAATPSQVADTTVTEFGRLLNTAAVGVWEMREDGTLDALNLGGWIPPVHQDWSSVPLDSPTPAAAAARLRQPVWLNGRADVRREYPHLEKLLIDRYRIPSVAALPLLVAGGCVGVIGVGFHEERRLTAAERGTALALADLCAQALQRAGLLAAENQARRAAEDLSKVVGGLSSAVTPAEVSRVILDYSGELGASGAVVMLRDGDELQLLGGTITGAATTMDLDAPHPLAHAARTGQPVWLANRSTLAWRERGFAPDEVELPVQVSVPLIAGWSVLGALGLRFDDGRLVSDPALRSRILTVAGQCAQALDRARLHQAEHEVAEVLQRSLLPVRLPRLARLAVAANYLPAASRAGGDWYDLLPTGDTRIAIAVGDVVGHGARAAAVMGQLRSALASTLLEGHSPAAALDRLDRFASRVDGALGTTCACLTLDWKTGELRYASAGHPPILLLEPAGPRFLDQTGGTVLGVRNRAPSVEANTVIAPGTTVLVYTDGLVERRQESLDVGLRRLARTAVSLSSREPEALADGLVELMLDDPAPLDDVAVVAVRLIPEPLCGRSALHRDAPREVWHAAARWSELAGLPDELVDQLRRTLGDAVSAACARADPGGAGVSGTAGDLGYEVARAADGGLDVAVRAGERTERFVLPPPGATTERLVTDPDKVPETARPAGKGRRIWSVAGDLTTDNVQLARTALHELLTHPGDLLIDLSRAGYLGSAAVGLLAEAVGWARDRNTGLSVRVSRGSFAERAIEITGLTGSLQIEWA